MRFSFGKKPEGNLESKTENKTEFVGDPNVQASIKEVIEFGELSEKRSSIGLTSEEQKRMDDLYGRIHMRADIITDRSES